MASIRSTKGFEKDEVLVGGVIVKLWDLSGDESYRGIWKDYVSECDVLVIVMDGSRNQQKDIENLEKMLDKIDFSSAKKCVGLFTKSDASDFNVNPLIDMLRSRNLMQWFLRFGFISVKDSDFTKSLSILANF